MNDFLECIAKFSLVLYVIAAVVLLCVAGLLICLPGLVKNIIYYCAISVCILGAVVILLALLHIVLCMWREKA